MKLCKSVIFEGFDNCGKSTAVNALSNVIGAKVYRAGGALKNQQEFVRCLSEQYTVAVQEPTILDRVTCISQPLYNEYMSDLELQIAALFFGNMSEFCSVIICRPPNKVCLDFSKHVVKSYDDEEHIKMVEQNSEIILSAYDGLTKAIKDSHIDVFVYDFTTMSVNDIVDFLQKKGAICL